jgi:hypothetical protein
MVYINVDGWKANFAIESLKQLKSGASAGVVVAAQLGIGTAGGGNEYRQYIFDRKTDPETSIEDGRVAWEAPPETNMADAKTLTAFIKWAREQRQEHQCCLVLWMDGVLPLYEPLARRKMGETPAPATGKEKPVNGGKMGETSAPATGKEEPVNGRKMGETSAPATGKEEPVNGRKMGETSAPATGKEEPVNRKRRIRYIEPYELRQALDDAKDSKLDKTFQIVAMDACSMSMVEYAYELNDVAEYLVASEEAVPYWSFPYTSILKIFSKGKNAGAICEAIAKDYTRAYQDCLCSSETGRNLETGVNPVMLSSLRLGKQGIEQLKTPLKDLVAELMQPGINNGKSALFDSILKARRNSRDFAFGMFVDLADFCDKLSKEENTSNELKDACIKVCEVVKDFVEANEVDPRAENKAACNGAMIYFPYFKESQEQDKIDVVLDKGVGSSSGEGGLGKSAAGVSIATRGSHYALRQEVIKDIEGYYQNPKFNFGQATEWYKFIRCVWSSILAQNEPWLLDLRYSAEQCATNLVNAQRESLTAVTDPKEGKEEVLPVVAAD